MIVATAGHIDHGKTRLVRALTNIDTDRLPEERSRGISIDLGFAHADLAGDGDPVRVSFIDVPGHERFIRNMLAGVSAIDAALIVVAADDGVMPQTREHVHILDLLEVRRGAVVLTKTDRVPRQRVDAAAAEVHSLLQGTGLANIERFAVSCVSGVGLPALRAWLGAEATAVASSSGYVDEGRLFRLAVDRVFTVAGSGTVVTGTVHSGKVAVGDHLLISPAGREVRVRGVQVHGTAAETACAGQRCALNLAGLAAGQVERGDWALSPAAHAPTPRLDVRLRLLPGEDAPLAHWTLVHLHLGTTAVNARVSVPGEGSVEPGTAAFVQLIPERPICALHGDRFVIRDQGAHRTIGGGVVLDPLAPRRARHARLRVAELAVLERQADEAILGGLLDLADVGIDLHGFAQRLGLAPERVTSLLCAMSAVVLGKSPPLAMSRTAFDQLTARVLAAVAAFHLAQPQAAGMEAGALRTATAPRLPAPAFQALLRELANRRTLVLSNDVVRLREHDATANATDERLWFLVQTALTQAGVHAPQVVDLADALEVKLPTLRDFLHRKSRSGEVLKVTPERFVLRETLATLAATAVEVARSGERGLFSAAQFRDAVGVGRGLAIHYLELLDRLGLTQRQGDVRRIARDFAPTLGAAQSLQARSAPDPLCKDTL